MKIEDLNYEQLREALSKLPMTWYPDLIRAMVEASLEKGTWHPMMGASGFVHKVEQDWHTRHRSCSSCGSAGFTQPKGTRNPK